VRALRASSDIPVLVLSARDSQNDKVGALDVGADDYVTKPFGMDELLARLRAALRRTSAGDRAVVFRSEHLTIDRTARRVERDGALVHLTPTEWNLLEVLLRFPGRVVSQRDLLSEVWGPQYLDEVPYLRVYVAQLRRKLEQRPAAPRHLLTEPGVGYRFEP
jgi:two-component system KDP operon response regulator KdpE